MRVILMSRVVASNLCWIRLRARPRPFWDWERYYPWQFGWSKASPDAKYPPTGYFKNADAQVRAAYEVSVHTKREWR